MRPMDQEYIQNNDIANRYMQGKLCAEESEEFEVYLMENSEIVDQLELDSMLINTLPLINTTSKPKNSFWQSLFKTPTRASLTTLGSCILVFTLMLNYNHFSFFEKTLSSPSMVYVSSVRGNTTSVDASFSLNEISSSVSLVLQDEFNANDKYQVDIYANTEKKPSYTGTYIPNTDREVIISLYKEMLQPGLMKIEYSLDESNTKKKKVLVVVVRD
ncbi:hypothetical protein Q4574_03555 [Aliiglaciecola sp. 3_MG-2023]|uniref:hypothetical protein n=1 Tax=Aliiglaciecola sp. 3_MG-2023 TaxID=3062644 RepID=UPI0026E2E49F|nr:hypothetical protein [Aliiglaciecola sp. 3_MG-2023]MDO6692344.1 hypothetical protein [Aliiglaciecola sp. 3_MG-2023]